MIFMSLQVLKTRLNKELSKEYLISDVQGT